MGYGTHNRAAYGSGYIEYRIWDYKRAEYGISVYGTCTTDIIP
jgi:hypothetical protein